MKNARNADACSAAKRRSRRLATTLLIATLIITSAATAKARTTGARAITGTCAPKDVRSDRLIENFKTFVGKTDMGGTVEKTTMGLANVTPSQVALVTDKAICAKAAAAFDTKQLQKRSSYTLYVVKLGSSYGVEDTRMLQAGFETADVYDSNWKYIGVRQIHS
jgi:hypothetical protein